ncbi:hypothetical protein EGH24_10405 [Halonotius terrestris]|uniref:Repeat domain-containing protein n=1 Tax=Halonotius terrestris TaxID=2487750 RepID=A0A8J8P8G6_9EURY|nr:hypothetical protein [Halonotius terrestris]TQQ79884.1 hypothetical protein EGH24_10405 [Halonotius terrestris]
MSWSRRRVVAGLSAATIATAGCLDSDDTATSGPTGSPPTLPATATYVYTHLRASGNRVLQGSGSIADASPVEIDISGRPAWLLASGATDSYWTVVTTEGVATTYRVSDGHSEQVVDHGTVPIPPVGYRAGGTPELVGRPADCAEHTHPVPIDGGLCYVASNGDVVVWRDASPTRLDVSAPVDARLVAVDDSRLAVYGAKTPRYRHGALGDTIEGGSMAIIDTDTERVVTTIELDAPAVFEDLSPLVADLDGDGERELVTTVADSADGARIRVYDADGEELATGPIYGSGWRHQHCVAPFGPAGGRELAVVRKPHVDRTVEFYRLADGELSVVATREGYSSHTYGSRNLDGGLAGDLNGDGQPELLVPTTDRWTLDALHRTGSSINVVRSFELDGPLTTNLTGVALNDDRVAVGAGTADHVRIWQG